MGPRLPRRPLDSLSTAQARELGRALLAAADLAGSPVIAARCRTSRRPDRQAPRRPRPARADRDPEPPPTLEG